MIRRFQIEDLILQDESGVVFRTLDTETGNPVAVRRFFPFGASGGGLQADEQAAYDVAIHRLAGIHHPALRTVVCGGCDPVDGMPFIATEWIEGESLDLLVAQSPLPPAAAAALISQALEVCELLSHVLGDEAVWVETDLQTIIARATNDRPFTFWISPFKWLGGTGQNQGLCPIITLTEQVMGWTGRIVNDQAGHGLGSWLKWLRDTAHTTTLRQARESLAASLGVEPPPPARNPVANALLPHTGQTSPPSRRRITLVLSLLALVGVGGWLLARSGSPAPHPIAHARNHSSPVAQVNQRAAELRALAAQADQEKAAVLAAQETAAAHRGGAISWDAHELLVANKNQPVVIEGVVRKIFRRSGGKTVYLLFSGDDQARNAARAGIRTGDAPPETLIEKLNPFVGKKVRVSGIVSLQTGFGLNRPDIIMTDISAVRSGE